MTKFRDDIRKLAQGGASAKELLTACDNLRDVGLPELGVKLDDKEGGALWKLYDADELKKEVAREREAKEEKERAEARSQGGSGAQGGGKRSQGQGSTE